MNTFTPILAQASANQEAAAYGALLFDVAAFGIILVAASVVMGIVTLIGMWKVFTKAGEPGWAVLIPVYNFIILLRIAGLPWYWVFTPLIVLIPILRLIDYLAYTVGAFAVLAYFFNGAGNLDHLLELVLNAGFGDRLLELALIAGFGMILVAAWVVWVHHRISTRFGQGVGFTIGLTLLGPIFWLILGFGSSKYVGEQPAQA